MAERENKAILFRFFMEKLGREGAASAEGGQCLSGKIPDKFGEIWIYKNGKSENCIIFSEK